MESPIKVLIADDHQIIIDGIHLMCEDVQDIQCVGSASNGEEAYDFVTNNSVDVVLMDVNMPVMNGIDACKKIKAQNDDISVLALTMFQEVSLIKKMMANGASGYLLKNAGQEELIKAVRTVFSGKKYFSDEVADIVLSNLSGKRSKTNSSPFPKLSRREKEILTLIVDEMTTQEIADKLFISFGTVETHRRNLLVKLGARNTAGLVRTAMEYDLI